MLSLAKERFDHIANVSKMVPVLRQPRLAYAWRALADPIHYGEAGYNLLKSVACEGLVRLNNLSCF